MQMYASVSWPYSIPVVRSISHPDDLKGPLFFFGISSWRIYGLYVIWRPASRLHVDMFLMIYGFGDDFLLGISLSARMAPAPEGWAGG